MSMPTIKEFPKGAVIYFEGDKSDKIYLLQSGQVILIYTSLDESKEEKYSVKVGEFFGVKSALGKYPREETAQVVGGARVVILSVEEFQKLALSNTRLVLQMSKVFSRELRQIHMKIREILKVDTIKDPEYELLNVGESFYKIGNIEHAEYVFEKYLSIYPNGKFVERAEMLLNRARKGNSYPSDIPSLEQYAMTVLSNNSGEVDENLKPVDDDFLQMPAIEEEKADVKVKITSPETLIQEIENLISETKYKEAYDLLIDAEKSPNFKNNPQFIETSLYYKGRILVLMKNYKAGMELLLQYLKDYPEGKYIKNAIFQIAIVFEVLKDYQKAKMFYKKVLVFKPVDEISKQAKRRLELIESM